MAIPVDGLMKRDMTRAVLIGVLTIVTTAVSVESSAQVRIRGSVQSESGEPVAAAHVLLESTSIGTITNSDGLFEIYVPEVPAILEIRHLGFRTARVRVEQPTAPIAVTLLPSIYSLDEIIVAERDFAENVIRKVIQNKQDWTAGLRPYRADGYTRITLDNAGEVVSIHEAVFDLFGSSASSSRAVVRSVRETSEIHEELGLLPAGMPLANLYADTVSVRGLDFIGPTHPDALSYYSFSFGRTRSLDDETVYDIYVAPLTNYHPAFIGVISILAEEHVMIRAQLRPARFVVFPAPTAAWDVFYNQQYFQVDGAWLPADLRLEGSYLFRSEGAEAGPVGIQQISLLTSYEFGRRPPAELESSDAVVVLDAESIESDYLFAEGINIVPLTPRELAAVFSLQQREMTLQKAYPPRRPLLSARIIRPSYPLPASPQFDWPRIAGFQPSVGLNRVDGYRTGIGSTWPIMERMYLEWRLTQASSLDRVRYHAKLTRLVTNRFWLSTQYTLDSKPASRSQLYPRALTSLATQLGGPDYHDYYWSRSVELSAGYSHRRGAVQLELQNERIESLESRLNRAWPFDRSLRDNPPVDSTTLSTVALRATVGDLPIAFRARPRNGLTVRVEQSLGVTGAAASYTLVQVDADAYLPTLYRSRLRPNGLHIRVHAGTYHGSPPAFRYSLIQTSLRAFGTMGALRGLPESPRPAPKYLGLFWEHDFRGVPFEWFGLSAVAESGVGLRLTGAHARAWLPGGDETGVALPDFHHELGMSITNPFRLPVRLDLTVRLDDGAVFFGFGAGRF